MKIAILGAGRDQKPLILKAREMGLETHVFAWKKGSVSETDADFFYPISINDKEKILDYCKNIKVNGILSIAADLAIPSVNYVAHELGLVGNSLESSKLTTNKYLMRRRLKECDINVPEFKIYSQPAYERSDFGGLPLVVKPVDREGSIGVTLASSPVEVNNAIKGAIYNSFSSICIVEEYIGGTEISVESVSIEGTHHLVAITEKITTGPPHFIEIHHRQPSVISNELRIKAADLMQKALNALGISNGACHSEFIIKNDNEIIVTEIAGRMGGDLIGSDLVPLSSGIDYLKAVIEISLGSFKNLTVTDYNNKQFASVSYLTSPAGTVQDIYDYTHLYPEIIKSEILVEKWAQVPQKTEGSRSRVARAVYLTGNADYYLPINNVFNILVQ